MCLFSPDPVKRGDGKGTAKSAQAFGQGLVTEAWDSREAHDESLEDPAVREMIGRARELMAGAPSATVLRPVGGKGL